MYFTTRTAESRATIARSTRVDFVRCTTAASANGNAMVRTMTVRCGQLYGRKTRSGIICASTWITEKDRQLGLANDPEIARNHIDDPRDVIRQLAACLFICPHGHDKQICVDRLNKIRGSQASVATDATRFARDLGRARG